jgi:hypothetical protein
VHQHVGVEHEQLLLFDLGRLAAARLRRRAGIARGRGGRFAGGRLVVACDDRSGEAGAAGSAGGWSGCNSAAVCLVLRPRGRARGFPAPAATARSGAAVFAASVIGWATLAGP